MRLQELLKEVACRGIVLEPAGGGERLKIVAPKGTITLEIRQALGRYKEAILTMMRYGLAGGCMCCKGILFWVSMHAVVICVACHPPANRSLAIEWIEFTN